MELALGHGQPFIKTASVESKAGHVYGGTVCHTDDEDVYYKINIMGHSILT